MTRSLLWLLILFPQEDAGARLKSGGWRAVQEYIDQGESSRAALLKAAAGTDPDAAFLASAALGELDCRRGGDFEPVPRTRASRGPSTAVVSALFKAAGLEASFEGLPAKDLSIPEGLTPAEALDAAARELNVEFVQNKDGVWKVGDSFCKGPRFASGRIRARIEELTRAVTWRPGLPPDCAFWLQGKLDGLGRFKEAVVYVDLRVIEAVDEHGHDLRSKREGDQASAESAGKHRDRTADFNVPLQVPDPGCARITRLRLAFDFAFRRKEESLSFDKLEGARNVKQKVGDVEAILLQSGMDDGTFRAKVKLRAPGIDARVPGDDENLFGNSLVLHLFDGAGKAWDSSSGSWSSDHRETVIDQSFNPGTAGPPAKLTFLLITEVEVRTVGVEFRDIPLR